MGRRLLLAATLALLAGCGSSGSTITVPPPCLQPSQTNCTPQTNYMAVAEKDGNSISLFQQLPYSGPPSFKIAAKGAESFALSFTVDTPRTLYVGEYPSTIASFDFPYTTPNGKITSGINDPAALAVTVSGGIEGLYVANRGANDVAFFQLASPSAPAFRIGGLHAPNGLALDSSGNLWVSEGADIVEFKAPLSQNSTPALVITSGLKSPNGIAFGDDGTMYVADAGLNAIAVYPPGAISPSVTVKNGIKAPTTPLIVSDNMLVPSTGNNTVAEYALPLMASSSPIAVNSTGMEAPSALTFVSR